MDWGEYSLLGYTASDLSRGLDETYRGLATEAKRYVGRAQEQVDRYVPESVRDSVFGSEPARAVGGAPEQPAADTAPRPVVEIARAPLTANKPPSSWPDISTLFDDALSQALKINDVVAYVIPDMPRYDAAAALLELYPDQPDMRYATLALLNQYCGEFMVDPQTASTAEYLSAIEKAFKAQDLSHVPWNQRQSVNFSAGLFLGVLEGHLEAMPEGYDEFLAALHDQSNEFDVGLGFILGLVIGVLRGVLEDLASVAILFLGLMAVSQGMVYAIVILLILAVLSALLLLIATAWLKSVIEARVRGYALDSGTFVADMNLAFGGISRCIDVLFVDLPAAVSQELLALKQSIEESYGLVVEFCSNPDLVFDNGKALGVEIGRMSAESSMALMEQNGFFYLGFRWGYNSGYIIYQIIGLITVIKGVLQLPKYLVKGGAAVGSKLLLPATREAAERLSRGRFGIWLRGLIRRGPQPPAALLPPAAVVRPPRIAGPHAASGRGTGVADNVMDATFESVEIRRVAAAPDPTTVRGVADRGVPTARSVMEEARGPAETLDMFPDGPVWKVVTDEVREAEKLFDVVDIQPPVVFKGPSNLPVVRDPSGVVPGPRHGPVRRTLPDPDVIDVEFTSVNPPLLTGPALGRTRQIPDVRGLGDTGVPAAPRARPIPVPVTTVAPPGTLSLQQIAAQYSRDLEDVCRGMPKLSRDLETLDELQAVLSLAATQERTVLSVNAAMGELFSITQLSTNPRVARVKMLRAVNRPGARTPDILVELVDGREVYVEVRTITRARGNVRAPLLEDSVMIDTISTTRHRTGQTRRGLAEKIRHGQIGPDTPGVILLQIYGEVPEGHEVLKPRQISTIRRYMRENPHVQEVIISYRTPSGNKMVRIQSVDSGLGMGVDYPP